jgi:hypothetical protein
MGTSAVDRAGTTQCQMIRNGSIVEPTPLMPAIFFPSSSFASKSDASVLFDLELFEESEKQVGHVQFSNNRASDSSSIARTLLRLKICFDEPQENRASSCTPSFLSILNLICRTKNNFMAV